MPLIGSLAVGLTARTAQFQKGFKRAKKTVARFSRDLGGMLRTGARRAAIALGAAAAAAGYFTRQAMQSIDQTSKLADELDISTQRLAGFQHAAGISGTRAEVLVKGLQRLVRRLGEARAGYGEGVKAMQMMGLSAEKMGRMLPADALLVISDRLRSMETATERAAAAYGLFGRQGQDLMNFLLMGSDGLRAMQREADALGLSFKRIEGAQVEEANDAITRLQAALKGAWQTMAIKLSPIVTELATKFTRWANSGPGLAKNIGLVFERVVLWGAKAMDVLELFKVGWHSLRAGISSVAAFMLRQLARVHNATAAAMRLISKLPGAERIGVTALHKSMQQQASLARGAAAGLESDASRSAAQAAAASARFQAGATAAQAQKWMDKLYANAAKRAANTIASITGGGGPGVPGDAPGVGAGGAGRPGEFANVALNRVALHSRAGRAGQRQAVHDDVVAGLLRQLVRRVGPVEQLAPVRSGVG